MTGQFLTELRSACEAHARRPRAVHGGRSVPDGQLGEWARRCAAWLQGLGVEPGDRVALFTAEKLPFLVAQLGAVHAGSVPLPLNPRLTREEMRYFLSDSGARVVVA